MIRKSLFNSKAANEALKAYVGVIFDRYAINISENAGYYRGPCPIHGGDNQSGFSVDANNGFWRCWTHNCQEQWGKNLIGLYWALMSNHEGKKVLFDNVKSSILEMVGKLPEKPISYSIEEFIPEPEPAGYSLKDVAARLIIPSPYFIKREFSPEILMKYCVGEPKNNTGIFKNRAVVPVTNSKNECYAYTGRATLPDMEPKWLHEGRVNLSLYGYSQNLSYIQEVGSVILVEGPGDVWRLNEAGINNALCIFGTTIKKQQRVLLEQAGVTDIMLGQDNDEAGDAGVAASKKLLEKTFNVKYFRPPNGYNDFGEVPIRKLHEL